jgi:hypothetical protein
MTPVAGAADDNNRTGWRVEPDVPAGGFLGTPSRKFFEKLANGFIRTTAKFRDSHNTASYVEAGST